MASYLITGSSRGLGFAIATYLVAFPREEVGLVFATGRSPSPALEDLVRLSLGRVVFVKMEVTDEASVRAALLEVQNKLGNDKGLDVLVNNAGVGGFTPNWTESVMPLNDIFNVNVTGTNIVTTVFLPLLRKGNTKKIVNMGSTMGSMNMAARVKMYPSLGYKVSKAALNSLTLQWALELADEGFTVLSLNTGWVKTDLGGTDMADLTPEQAAKGLVEGIMKAGTAENGTFPMIHVPGWEKNEGVNQYDGNNRPW